MKAFERAEFEAAARHFLHADELVPNTDAVHNAFTAAQRAKHDALVATAAERVTSREGLAKELTERASKTLAKVKRRVAHLVLSCSPPPCELAIDGQHAATGPSYALPGTRTVTARWADGSLAERSVEAAAAGEQTIALELESRLSPPVAAIRTDPPPPEPGPTGGAFGGGTERPAHRARPLSPPVFYAGAGITLVLAAATTWSGIDTLNARNRLPGTESDNEAVVSRAHRTDALLIGTVVAGAATVAVGLVWTDWDGTGSEVALRGALGERGAVLSVTATH